MIHFNWHYPYSIDVGSTHILLHVILEYLAFFIGFRYYLFLKKKQGDIISSDNRLWIFIGAIAGALIGSRLVGGLESITELKIAPSKLLHFYLNKTVVGGFIGGLFGVEAVKKIIGEKNNSGDLFAYPMIFALIIGRLGCASMGMAEDVYGVPTHFFTGINLGDGLMRHPLMWYEIFYLILLWIALKWTEKKYTLANGSKYKIFMMSYLLFRFFVEFLKTREQYFLGLGAIQIACLLCLVYYGKYFLRPKKLLKSPLNSPKGTLRGSD